MKLVKFFIFISLLGTAQAAIITVDNNPNSVGQFTTLAEAQTAANEGDTLYVYPSAAAYAGITVTKQLYFFGLGYNLDIYEGQASNATSSVGNMTFNVGSEGSELQGFDGNFDVTVNASNIKIKKNNLNVITISSSFCVVIQNDIDGYLWHDGVVRIGPNIGDILIADNKIRNPASLDHAIYSNTSSNVTIVNNVINAGSAALANLSITSVVQNNIILNGSCSTNAIYQHNMCNSNQLPETNGNIINVDMATVFEDPNNFVTGLHLLPDSPAIGAGFNGTDMGIYGGNHPYVDGGFPNLPSIFYLESEATTSQQNGLDVVIKARSNRE